MQCPVCAEPNPVGNRYCGACGTALDEAAFKLHQQILAVVRNEFEDEELVAVRVADAAEDRLWRWGKVLGLAFTLAVAGLGFFGFTSYREAKARIGDTAQAAVGGLNQVADQNKQAIINKGAETISQMQQAEASSISQVQNQAKAAGSQVAAVVLRARTNNGQLAQAEQTIRAMQGRIDALASIREASPDTPIGNLNGGLFSAGGYGVGGYGSNPYGGISTSRDVAQPVAGLGAIDPTLAGIRLPHPPYKEGASGSGVTTIQNRLSELGCFSGPSTGAFDAATSAAVIAFVNANGRPSPESMAGLLTTSRDAPAVLEEDSTPGTVDYRLWAEMFDSSAKKCQ